MHLANERAGTAPTVPALNPNRLAGRPSINPHSMEVTMVTNITPGTLPAIPERYRAIRMMGGRIVEPHFIVFLEVADRPWGDNRKTPHQKWNAYLGDEMIVKRHRDPEHAACRALFAAGNVGTVLFVHRSTGVPGISLDIEKAINVAVYDDGARGLYHAAYHPYDPEDNTPAGEDGADGASVAEDQLAAPNDAPGVDAREAVTNPAIEAAERNLRKAADELFALTPEDRALLDGEAR